MRIIIVLLALMLALPTASSGEGTDVPVDAFIERTGIDAALRGKVEDFLRDRGITARTISMIDDARLCRYAEHLAAGVQNIFPHHGPEGNLRSLGKLFQNIIQIFSV